MANERPPTSAYYGIAEYDRADYGVVHADFVEPGRLAVVGGGEQQWRRDGDEAVRR